VSHEIFPVDSQHGFLSCFNMSNQEELDLLRGTLDMLVLKTLETLGSQHGYGIARRIEQVSDAVLGLNQGTLYPALLRLEQQGLISSDWGVSENNRRARFYSLTRSGRARLKQEVANWQRMTAAVNNIIAGRESNPA
jgi:transcriptional regulator